MVTCPDVPMYGSVFFCEGRGVDYQPFHAAYQDDRVCLFCGKRVYIGQFGPGKRWATHRLKIPEEIW